jgi:hypothetical protein
VNTDQFLISFCRFAPHRYDALPVQIHLLLKRAARRTSRAGWVQ